MRRLRQRRKDGSLLVTIDLGPKGELGRVIHTLASLRKLRREELNDPDAILRVIYDYLHRVMGIRHQRR
jgi:hypothetical protein